MHIDACSARVVANYLHEGAKGVVGFSECWEGCKVEKSPGFWHE